MRRLNLLYGCIGAVVCAWGGLANADIIAGWTFETTQPASAGPFAAEVGSGDASGNHAGASTYSSPAGNGSLHSFSSNGWAVGDYYQFQVSTLGYADLSVAFDQTSSNTGPGEFRLTYSIDGSTFSDFTTYSVLANASPNPPWNSTTNSSLYGFSFDLSSITTINDAENVYLRLIDNSMTSADGGAVGSTGTDRVDNFEVSATAVSEPSALFLLSVGTFGLAFCGWRRFRNSFLTMH